MVKQSSRERLYKYKFSFVMPVHNVEKYLSESIESIIQQTVSFIENCEIILVNDGSTDNSEAVCESYVRKYPNNVIYIKQKNQGPGAARNRGIKIAKGKYISLLDPDDKISPDTLHEVYRFFEDNYDKIDFVAIKYMFFDAVTGKNHPLNYKFIDNHIIDVEKDFDHIQMSAATAFFKKEALQRFLFKESVGCYSEDAHLLGRMLLENGYYGVVEKPIYYYRKRQDETSSLDSAEYDPFWYFETINRVWKDLISHAERRNNGVVPKFIQYMIVYEVHRRLKQRERRLLTEETRETYINSLADILQPVQDEVIIDARVPVEFRLLMLSIRDGRDIEQALGIDADGDYSWKGKKIYKRKKVKFTVDSLSIDQSELVLKGWFSGFTVKGIDFFVDINGTRLYLKNDRFRPKVETYSLGKTIYKRNAFTVQYKLSRNYNLVRFGIESGKKPFFSNIYKIKIAELEEKVPYSFTYDSKRKWILVFDGKGLIIIQRLNLLQFVKREARYLTSLSRSRGKRRAVTELVKQIYRSRWFGILPRFASRIVAPGGVRVAENRNLRYEQLFKTAAPRKFLARSQVCKNQRALRMAAVMDDFTYSSFRYECDILQLTPDNWLTEIKKFKPDLLFVESAWRGKDELWSQKISKTSQELCDLVDYCKNNSIPTVFWNKEDPAHTFEFMQSASLFDFVFTTDTDSIEVYRRVLGHGRVYLLPFATQPKDHNPIEKYKRKDKFNFAGSYYPKYEERNRNFKEIVDAVTTIKGLDIYDRNYYRDVVGGIYKFDGEFKQYVKGNLPYDQIDKAYKGYRYAITLNTIKNSPTMFARRAFELVASNTITVGNYSKGIVRTLGGLTIASDDGVEILERLETITATRARENAFRLLGLRKVLSEHSYSERLSRILRVVYDGYSSSSPDYREVSFIGYAKNRGEADSLLKTFSMQKLRPVSEVVVCEFSLQRNDDKRLIGAHRLKRYIDKAADTIVFNPKSYYGEHYAVDLALATHYSDADIIGKGAFYARNSHGEMEIENDELRYVKNVAIRTDRSLMTSAWIKRQTADGFLSILKSPRTYKQRTLSIDEFSYSPRKKDLSEVDRSIVDGQMTIDCGQPIEDIYADADRISNNRFQNYVARTLKKMRIVKTYIDEGL